MIDPQSEDIGRTVIYRGASGPRDARIKEFSKSWVWIVFSDDGATFPTRRHYLEWSA